MNIYIDTNVFMDAILLREMHQAPKQILDDCKAGRFTGFTSAISIANLAYLLRAIDQRKSKIILQDLLSFISVAPLTSEDLSAALDLPFSDREDAFQYAAALNVAHLKAIITRNVKDYKAGDIPVMTPKQLIEL